MKILTGYLHPKAAAMKNNITKWNYIVLADHYLNMYEIVETVSQIFVWESGKPFSHQCLTLFMRMSKEFLCHIVNLLRKRRGYAIDRKCGGNSFLEIIRYDILLGKRIYYAKLLGQFRTLFGQKKCFSSNHTLVPHRPNWSN